MKKIFVSALAAIFDLKDGVSIMSGGFGLCGNPENLIFALEKKGTKNLTIISNNCGTTEHGLGILLKTRQVKKIFASYVGDNAEFERQFLTGELEVELNPQGTLAERIRAGGAGIPAFYTPTGVGTQVALGGLPMLFGENGEVKKTTKPKETKEFDGKTFVLERALKADYAIVRAHVADTFGNIVFRKTAQNFSSMMCMAAKTTIVEAEKIVAEGELDPDGIHIPGIYVHRIVQGKNYEKWIEQRTVRPKA